MWAAKSENLMAGAFQQQIPFRLMTRGGLVPVDVGGVEEMDGRRIMIRYDRLVNPIWLQPSHAYGY